MKFNNLYKFAFAAGLLVSTPACTDLEEDLYSSVTAEQFYADAKNQTAAVAPVYAMMRNLYHHEDFWGSSQVSSDEMIIPARGGDWYDGGKWLSLNAHTWDASFPHLPRMWETPYTGIARANGVLENLGEGTDPALVAEIKFLRAFYYSILMDLFGGVPLVLTQSHNGDTPASTRAEVYDFVINEIESIKDQLPTNPEYGRVGQGVAYSYLARLYLNEGVYNQTSYTVSDPSATALDKVIAYTTKVEGMGYALNSKYPETFLLANEINNPDYIFYIPYTAVDGMGNHGNSWGVHYNTYKVNGMEWFVPSKWNGPCLEPHRFDSFDASDTRQSVIYNSYEMADGTIILHTNDVPIFDANKDQGLRIMKWDPDPSSVGVSWGGWSGNDFPLIRYADVLLMHAEALARKGDTSGAMSYINKLRTEGNRFEAGASVANATTHYNQLKNVGKVQNELDFILMERGWELLWEGTRRQDLVRFGKFLEAWQNKQMENDGNVFDSTTGRYTPSAGKPSDGAHRLVFPIPPAQVAANPNLNQNQGY